MVVKKPPNGEVLSYYLNVVLTYDGTDCLTWPYALTEKGYGHMHKYGEQGVVSRFLCADVHGGPPTPGHEAAHSCGNGHLGCVAKGHLSWKTSKENKADKLIHGTHTQGETHSVAKLSQEQVVQIIFTKGTKTQREVAKDFGVSQATVSRLYTGKTWEWMDNTRA